MSVKNLCDRIIQDGKLTDDEHQELKAAILQDGEVDAVENEQILRIMKMLDQGELEVV